VVTRACKPGTQEAEGGRSRFEASLGCTESRTAHWGLNCTSCKTGFFINVKAKRPPDDGLCPSQRLSFHTRHSFQAALSESFLLVFLLSPPPAPPSAQLCDQWLCVMSTAEAVPAAVRHGLETDFGNSLCLRLTNRKYSARCRGKKSVFRRWKDRRP
jgi:hypothetical protein